MNNSFYVFNAERRLAIEDYMRSYRESSQLANKALLDGETLYRVVNAVNEKHTPDSFEKKEFIAIRDAFLKAYEDVKEDDFAKYASQLIKNDYFRTRLNVMANEFHPTIKGDIKYVQDFIKSENTSINNASSMFGGFIELYNHKHEKCMDAYRTFHRISAEDEITALDAIYEKAFNSFDANYIHDCYMELYEYNIPSVVKEESPLMQQFNEIKEHNPEKSTEYHSKMSDLAKKLADRAERERNERSLNSPRLFVKEELRKEFEQYIASEREDISPAHKMLDMESFKRVIEKMPDDKIGKNEVSKFNNSKDAFLKAYANEDVEKCEKTADWLLDQNWFKEKFERFAQGDHPILKDAIASLQNYIGAEKDVKEKDIKEIEHDTNVSPLMQQFNEIKDQLRPSPSDVKKCNEAKELLERINSRVSEMSQIINKTGIKGISPNHLVIPSKEWDPYGETGYTAKINDDGTITLADDGYSQNISTESLEAQLAPKYDRDAWGNMYRVSPEFNLDQLEDIDKALDGVEQAISQKLTQIKEAHDRAVERLNNLKIDRSVADKHMDFKSSASIKEQADKMKEERNQDKDQGDRA